MNEIILGISGLPFERAENCVQELTPIANGEFKKSINGNLVFIKTSERKKYRSVISCGDLHTPIIDKLWIGSQINIGCIQNLRQVIEPRQMIADLIRPAVAESISAVNDRGEDIPFTISGNRIMLRRENEEKIFVSFRPWLTMVITNFSMKTNEWEMESGWKLESEEI